LIQKVSHTLTKESIQKVSIRQIKAARHLLGWSQQELASRARVSLPTIKRLEAEDGLLGGRPNTARKILDTLQHAGIRFIAHDGEILGVTINLTS
jgi:predicted transcriptional regulator